SASTPALRVDLLDRGRNWVKVTVLDDDTGAPVPCRVHFRSPEGVPYQPHGHHNQVNSNLGTWHIDVGGDVRLGQITYAYIDGRCEGWLPRGEVIVDVARGFEYEPLREKVTIKPGQQDLKLRLKRWTNMNAKRWFSGDSHVHFLSTQGSHFESQGEDLNVVNLLQSQWGGLYTNTEDFTGRPSVSRDGSNIVYTSQENRQHFLGHMILWGLKEQVMPWCSDGPNEGELGGIMQTTMSHWADAAHAQGGRVVIPHFPHPNGEPATLIATGRVDAVEMIRHERFNHVEYYRYLNCGYRLPLVGGTDKMSNEVPVGLYRTYAYVPEDQEFNYENWCAAVSAGRTFLSGGPLLELSVDGHQIGDTVRMSGAGTVEVHASAESILPIHSLQIVMNGRVVASTENPSGGRRLELRESVRIDANSWLAVRCGGPNYIDSTPHYDVWNRGVFAHTSPIYLAVGGDWEMYDQNAAQYMLTLIEGGMSYIRQTSHQHAPDSVSHHHGEEDHMAYLLRPFREAHEAVLARMHLQR
ncbi:MAG: CehA/McbA family metallohydrolase, partial [Chloroflexi bacterium]|nr:CehA/McbA family metallohydrolase [Chloroflexota bacterium]